MTASMIVSSDWFVGLLVDVSLKAILLAALAGAGMWLFRVRATSLRHRVWTAVLTGMIVLPVLIAWSPGMTLPTWAYPDLRFQSSPDLNDIQEVVSPVAMRSVLDETPLLAPAATPEVAAKMPATIAVEKPSEFSTAEPIAVELPAANRTARTLGLLIVCYSLGVAMFGGRLLVGLLAAMRLVRAAAAD